MKLAPSIKVTLTVGVLTLLGLVSSLCAATITKSTSAPAVNDEDIANNAAQTATEKWWNDNAASGAAMGQTFRVRNAALRLKAITYKTTTSTQPTKIFTIRVGTISGTTFTPVYSETATQSVAWAAQDYVTWRFATPFVLQPNMFYGIDVAMKSSTSDWTSGIPYLSVTADEFSDGERYRSGTSGAGNSSVTKTTEDRVFHLDIEKPLGGWSLVATSPADNATNAFASNPLLATFSQDIGRGTGNITLRNLTDGVDTVIPVNDSRVLISENLLTVNPGSNYLANRAYAVRIDPTAITNVLGANYPGITNDTTWNFNTGAGDPLYLALVALKNHITGVGPLTAAQISAQKVTIDQERTRLADSAAMITASFDLVKAYDNATGNHWYINGLPARDSVTNDIHWTLYNVQQYIMDVIYEPFTLANYESLLNGFKFNSASNFPGPCKPPVNSNQTHTATVSANYLNTRGWPSQGDGGGSFARKPTGCYLAPGSIATVTVPSALAGKGYKVRVGAHSWDFSNKPTIKRLDRSSLVFPINSVDTKIACPHGGGIYIEVPWLANGGTVNVQIKNAVRSPYFSAKSFHQTTPTQWLSERTNAAPWADFQSDKFMTQVPSSWIYSMPDPTKLMTDWDAAMDACNDLMGFPRLRGKETFYLQVDVQIRTSVFAPGYPAVNVGGYSATANYNNGYNTHYLVRGPQYGTDDAQVEFHEQGHGYFFDKFPGETESNVNLLFVPVLQRKFGTALDPAFRASLGDGITYRTLETTAMAWMTVFNFSPREVEMADAEKAYQLKGHAKFVDIARIYGWGVLSNYWSSFVNDYEKGSNYATDTDSLLLRLSRSVGADIRPLFHFWGIYPANPATLKTAITNANLVAPVEIYDTLVRYKSLVPTNNSAFTNFAYKWWGRKPTMSGAWEEREHARQWDTNALYSAGDQQRSQATNPGEIYNENSFNDITNRVQELINLYYPNGRPLIVNPPAILGFSPADNSTNVALAADFVVTFDKAIVRGTGNITLKNLTDGTQTTIAITNTTQVSVVGEVLTINPSTNLIAGKVYAIQIPATAIGGLATNAFAGLTNDTTWSFTTTIPDVTPPLISSFSPAAGANNVTVSANLVAIFNEPIMIGTGNLTLKNLTDGTLTTIAVTDTNQVSVAGPVLTINPAAKLIAGKTYAVQIAATAIDDIATNSFVGIANDTTWNFAATAVVNIPPVGGYARWFDASKLVLTNGASVTNWNDTSTNAAHATVPSGNAKPVFLANSGMESGRPVIYFAKGTGATNSAALRFTADNNIRTVFSIFKGESFLLTHASTYHFHRPSNTNQADPLWTANTSVNIKNGSTYVNGNLMNGLTFAMPTNLHNGFNLVSILTTNNVQADSFNKDRTVNSGNQFQAEVILYDRVLDDIEREAVEAYLTDKWFSEPVADYAGWATNYPGADLSNPNADFDGDGQPNEQERVWGLNPTNASSRSPFVATSSLATGTFRYTRRMAALSGLNYTVWTSTNLVTWAQDTGAAQTPGAPVAEVETVTVTLSPMLPTAPRIFVRMRAAP